MAIEHNVTLADKVFVGEDKVINFVIVGVDGVTPENISGWGLRWDLKSKASPSAEVLITKQTGGQGAANITITDAANGQGKFLLTSAETDPMKPLVDLFHSMSRTDQSAETVCFWGKWMFNVTTTPSQVAV